jgi:Phosphatidylinositol-4-phosphate 5-Kinase
MQASFLEFAPHYFAYQAECGASGSDSCLSRVLGFYHVLNRNESWSLDIVVTENVFYEQELVKTFDLKGTLRSGGKAGPADGGGDRNRGGGGDRGGERSERVGSAGAGAADARNMTLLDDQLRRSIMTRPLTVAPAERHRLMVALRADTAFLSRVGVMDYSLLLGIDRHHVRCACRAYVHLPAHSHAWFAAVNDTVCARRGHPCAPCRGVVLHCARSAGAASQRCGDARCSHAYSA